VFDAVFIELLYQVFAKLLESGLERRFDAEKISRGKIRGQQRPKMSFAL
jgi:hypothetical protein